MKFYAQKKYDGIASSIHYDGKDKVLIFSDDGSDITSRLPCIVKEVKEILKSHSAILLAEIEKWKGNEHLGREFMSGYLHEKSPPECEGLVANVFDIVYWDGKDIHNLPFEERLLYLKKIPFKESTIGVPRKDVYLNLSPTYFVDSEEKAKTVLNKLANAPASEGAMLKLPDFKYSLSGSTTGLIKYKKYAEIHAIVWAKQRTKDGKAYNYYFAIKFDPNDNVEPNSVVEVKGKEYLKAGRTYNTKTKCDIGDKITVRFHSLNLYKNYKTGKIRVHLYEPIFYEKLDEDASIDSVKTVLSIGKESGLLNEKLIKNPQFLRIEPGTAILTHSVVLPVNISHCKILTSNPFFQKVLENENDFKGFSSFLKAELPPDFKGLNKVGFIHPSFLYAIQTEQISYDEARNLITKLLFVAEEIEGPTEKLKSLGIFKAANIYLVYPDESKNYKYVIQAHFRGKSVHWDLRMESSDKDHLIGWTIDVQMPGVLKKPVLTMEDAREALKNSKLWKINPLSGEWAKRKRGSKYVNVSVLCETKAKEPLPWMDFEGVTRAGGREGEPGSTKQYPGVFIIIDRGEVEYLAQKTYVHEYFFHGKILKGRYVMRQLENIWREENKNLDFFEKNAILSVEDQLFEKKIEAPIEPPVGQSPKGKAAWFFIRPKDQTPYVLSNRAVKKEWLPPKGISAIQRELRKKVPKELQYWKVADRKKALELRKELRKKFLDLKLIKSLPTGKFVLQYQYWRGPIIIREGPSREQWNLLLDFGGKLLKFVLNDNILEVNKTAGYEDKVKAEDFSAEGEIKPKTRLNPTKETPCWIEKLDSGSFKVFDKKPSFIKVEFKGKKLGGLWAFSKKENVWEIERSKLPGE